MTTTKKKKQHKVDLNILTEMMEALPQTPEGTSGDFSIKHTHIPAGDSIPIISMRNALLMNQQPANLVLTHPHTIRYLKENDDVWMSDTPQEVYQMRDVIRQAHGHVLIGGLGLGVVHHLVGKLCKDVRTVTTVECERDVLELVRPHVINPKVDKAILRGDLFQFLENLKEDKTKYDFAFFDIWAGTGEYTWVEYVVPLRRLCRRQIPQGQILCWNEDEMKGQLRDALRRAAYMDGAVVKYYEPLRVFAQNCMISHPKFSKEYMATMKTAHQMENYWNTGADNKGLGFLIERYLKPGTDTWERDFGQLWDQHVTKRQK
jgi:hypothetical protein